MTDILRRLPMAAIAAVFVLAACATGPKPNPTPVAAAPQPDAARLQAGLSVRYWPYDVADLREVEGNVWYPLRIVYFQRRGAWGLQLLWAPEGEPLTIVPAAALMRGES